MRNLNESETNCRWWNNSAVRGTRVAFTGLLTGFIISLASCTYVVPSSDGAAASLLNSLGVAIAASAGAPAVTLGTLDSAFVSGAGGKASTGFTWTSTVDGTYSVRKDATNCSAGSMFMGPTDVVANVVNAGPTINATDLAVGSNDFCLCVVYTDTDEVDRTLSATFSVTRDDTAPAAPSSSPVNSATNVSPNPGTITLVFTDTMDTSNTPTITATSGATSIPTAGTVFTWTDANTLKVQLSWSYFPENVNIAWTITAAGLQDAAGNALSSNVVRSFNTTTNKVSYPVADSGATQCFGTGNSSAQSCPHATLHGQDGDTVLPVARSFTGPAAHGTYTSDYTTTDNVTGLVWKSCVEGKSGATCGTGSPTSNTWFDAINSCAALNSMNSGAGYAGLTDWRLPSIMERMTITDNSGWYPSLDSGVFPGSPGGGSRVWSSTGDSANTNFAFNLYIGTSGTSRTVNKTATHYTRCVSGSSGSTTSLTDNSDGTITDNVTNLKWMKCSFGRTYSGGTCMGTVKSANWDVALADCLAMGGSWRLPSLSELKSILDVSSNNPTYNSTYFSDSAGRTWTSTTYNGSHSQAHAIQFNYGDIYRDTKSSGNLPYRCVSTGP